LYYYEIFVLVIIQNTR